MSVFLITYDLNNEIKRPPVVEHIKKAFPNWAKLSESSYAVNTTMSDDSVFHAISPLFDQDDRLYIITLKKPFSGYGSKDVNEWLEKFLTY